MENIYETNLKNRVQIAKWALFVLGFVLLFSVILIIGLIIASGDKSISMVNTDQSTVIRLINNIL